MSLLRPADIACQEVVELVTDYLEDALSRRDRRRFEHHLTGCPECTAYLAQMCETIKLTARLLAEDLSPEMRRELAEVSRRRQSGSNRR
jgi:anti-sigma factor RsiW